MRMGHYDIPIQYVQHRELLGRCNVRTTRPDTTAPVVSAVIGKPEKHDGNHHAEADENSTCVDYGISGSFLKLDLDDFGSNWSFTRAGSDVNVRVSPVKSFQPVMSFQPVTENPGRSSNEKVTERRSRS